MLDINFGGFGSCAYLRCQMATNINVTFRPPFLFDKSNLKNLI